MSAGGSGDGEGELGLCCDIRQACHQTCGSLKTACDAEFTKCLESTCEAMPDEDAQKACDSSAGIYKLMVNLEQSCNKFDSEQYAHCDCVKEADVGDRREQLLTKFYKKVNPESIQKVGSLMAKIDSSRKMASLLVKLYKKYPQVIKKVKDPQQEELERMMKQAKKDDPEKTNDNEQQVEDDNVEDLGTQEL